MERTRIENAITQRISAMNKRIETARDADLYYYNLPISEIHGGSKVVVNGREMGMFASYSYLGLVGHPRICAAAKEAIDRFGTGTHGVRMLAGSLVIHQELEKTISEFRGAEAAVTYTSGYVTNLTAISTLLARGDYVISDKLNHASIVDGCMMSGAKMLRFRHNDVKALEDRFQQIPPGVSVLVVVDSVFSMDGDITNLPGVVEVCKKYGAMLMVDEAHSIGVLGKTGRGIEEHFGMEGTIDIKMGTLSKTIPSVGGYIAGNKDMVEYLRHASRAYIFSAALPPAQAAAAKASIELIMEEPWRVKKLQENSAQFIHGLKARGFNTMNSETAIVPVFCGSDESAYLITREVHKRNTFVLPVVSPAVPPGLARLRATVTSAHEPEEIEHSMNIIQDAGKIVGII